MRRAAATLAGVALLAGCEVGPDYHRPAAIVSPAFKELAGWKPAQPRDMAPRGAWWSVYDDPELDSLEQQVAVSNQNLKAAVAAYDEAVAIVGEVRSQLFPTATGTFSDQRSAFGTGGRGGGSTAATTTTAGGATIAVPTGAGGGTVLETLYTAEASASWAPDIWGRVRRTVNSDVAAAQASAADAANAELSAQGTLAADYFNLRAADALKALLDRTVVDYRRALTITQNQYNAGVAARSDVLTAQTQLQTAIAAEVNTDVLRSQYEHAIAVLTGRPPADLSIPPGDLPQAVPVVPAGVPSELLERRPDIAAAERTMQTESELIGAAIAAYYPTITLTALTGFEGNAIGTLFNAADRVWSLGADASETLYSGGARPAAVRAARAAYDSSAATYRQTVLSAFEQVEDELSTLRTLQQQYAAQQDAVRLARQSLDVTLNQYRAGTQSYTAVITAEDTLLSNEETLLSVQQQRLVASVTLIEALGGGWSAAELPREGAIRTANPIFP